MRFEIRFTNSGAGDLAYFTAREQRVITAAIRLHLGHEADRESRRRKKLKPNPLGPWELKAGDYRVFYDVEAGDVVKVTAVGEKTHNELLVRGRRVDV